MNDVALRWLAAGEGPTPPDLGARWVASWPIPSGDPVSVRFGSGRGYGSGAPGHPANENILDSLQHLLNHVPALRPITPRDVVWIMNTGVATE